MRITRIVVNDFRGFPGPGDYEFRLDGQNLLLFGENGSGKSSLFLALREFFNTHSAARAFADFRNVFTHDTAGLPLSTGKVTVEFDDGSGAHAWDTAGNARPLAVPAVAEAALRFGAVDYRAMLRTHFSHQTGLPNLYELLVEGVLRRLPVLASGGLQTTLGAVSDAMHLAIPSRNSVGAVNRANAACTEFNTVLANHLPAIVTEANQILATFGGHGVTFQLVPTPARYERSTKRILDKRIDFVAQIFGHGPAEPQHFLNEARLSALALAIYLAAIRVTVPPAPPALPGAPVPAKLIILDDVLIGIDMSNRQPLLNLLRGPKFADWQVLLLTHDQAWYSLARAQLNGWKAVRLAAGNNGSHDVPILYDDTSLIDRAEHYLNFHGDERAAGIYLRLAFEEMLKSFCARTQVSVAYHPADRPPRSTNVFWDPIRNVRVRNAPLVDAGLQTDVEACRRNVANPLCHYGNNPPLRAETITAISVLRRLQVVLDGYSAKSVQPPQDPRPALERAVEACGLGAGFSAWSAAVLLRTAFDASVASLAIRRQVAVRYSEDLVEFSTPRLWAALRAAGLNATHAAQCAAIGTHAAIFLQQLDFAVVQALPQVTMQTALNALLDPALGPGTPPRTWIDAIV